MIDMLTLLVPPVNLYAQEEKGPEYMESVAVYDVSGGVWLVQGMSNDTRNKY